MKGFFFGQMTVAQKIPSSQKYYYVDRQVQRIAKKQNSEKYLLYKDQPKKTYYIYFSKTSKKTTQKNIPFH